MGNFLECDFLMKLGFLSELDVFFIDIPFKLKGDLSTFNLKCKISNCGDRKGFVKMSASWSLMGTKPACKSSIRI